MRYNHIFVSFALMNLDTESEEIRVIVFQIHDFRFLRTYIKPKPIFKPRFCRFEQLYGITVFSAKDFEIIGISYDIALFQLCFPEFAVLLRLVLGSVFVDSSAVLMPCRHSYPLACYPPVKFVQNNVG